MKCINKKCEHRELNGGDEISDFYFCKECGIAVNRGENECLLDRCDEEKQLTKKECIKALHKIQKSLHVDGYFGSVIYDEINVIRKLINEHFYNQPLELEKQLKRIQELELNEKQWIETERDYRDELKKLKNNPPLKFEDLKEGMWVWDNVLKRYMKIYDISYSEESFNVNGEWCLDDLYLEEFEFKENRFYIREVK